MQRNPAKAHSHFLGCLFNLGLPVTHSGPSPWNLLIGDDVLALSDAELDATLRGGALLNTVAAEALALRGLEERIGVSVGEPFALDELYCEEWLPSGRRLHAALGVEAGEWRRLTDRTGRGRCTSQILNCRKDVLGPALRRLCLPGRRQPPFLREPVPGRSDPRGAGLDRPAAAAGCRID